MKKVVITLSFIFCVLYSNAQNGVRIESTGTNSVSSSSLQGNNYVIGKDALSAPALSGTYNTAVGHSSMLKNEGGSYNNAFGAWSLLYNISGNVNFALGHQALFNNKTGHYNNAIGYQALLSNDDGESNYAFGYQALKNSTSGHYNLAFGHGAAYHTNGSTRFYGSYNVALGKHSLFNNIIGNNNLTLGNDAGYNILGSNNTIIGNNVKGTATMSNHVVIGDGEGNERIFINDKGNMGLGRTSPSYKLHITGGTVSNEGENGLAAIGLDSETIAGRLVLAHAAADGFYSDQAKIGDAVLNTTEGTNTNLVLANESKGAIKFVTQGQSDGTSSVRMKVANDGKVLIGVDQAPATAGDDADVSGYKLFVTGGVLTEQVRISVVADWADYVFDQDYDLKPLSEVESFINDNGHLPNVPSAEQVAKEGINVGDITTIQQEKIEELTLYLIEQQKEVEALKQARIEQQNQIEQLKLLVESLVEKK